MGAFDETLVAGADGAKSHVFDRHVRLVKADGSDFEPAGPSYTLPAATTSELGGVRKAAELAKVTAADAAAAAGDAPTKEEFDKLVALANATKAALNGNADKSKAAGQSA